MAENQREKRKQNSTRDEESKSADYDDGIRVTPSPPPKKKRAHHRGNEENEEEEVEEELFGDSKMGFDEKRKDTTRRSVFINDPVYVEWARSVDKPGCIPLKNFIKWSYSEEAHEIFAKGKQKLLNNKTFAKASKDTSLNMELIKEAVPSCVFDKYVEWYNLYGPGASSSSKLL